MSVTVYGVVPKASRRTILLFPSNSKQRNTSINTFTGLLLLSLVFNTKHHTVPCNVLVRGLMFYLGVAKWTLNVIDMERKGEGDYIYMTIINHILSQYNPSQFIQHQHGWI